MELPIKINKEVLKNNPLLPGILEKLSSKISPSGVSKEKETIIAELVNNIKNKRRIYREHQLVLETVSDISTTRKDKDCNVSTSVARKVDRIIAVEKLKQLTNSAAWSDGVNQSDFLDSVLTENCAHIELNSNESSLLISAVEQRLLVDLASKSHDLDHQSNYEFNKTKLKLIGELDDEVSRSSALLARESSILEQMCDLKFRTTDEIFLKKTALSKGILNTTESKAKLMDAENMKLLYCDEETAKAVDKTANALQAELAASKVKLRQLEAEVAMYEDIAANEKYDAITKEYNRVQKEIQNKKWALSSMPS